MKDNAVKFNGYSIKKFVLEKKDENNNKKTSEENKIELNFEYSQKSDNKNLYCLNMKVKTITQSENIEAIIEGYFEFGKEIEEELISYFLKVTAPTVLYPYCRTFISSVTSFDSNKAVLLPIINFADFAKNDM